MFLYSTSPTIECPWSKFTLAPTHGCPKKTCGRGQSDSADVRSNMQQPSRSSGDPPAGCEPTTPTPNKQTHIVGAKILMKIMYGARFARPDLLRAVCVLARRLTQWDTECDKRVHRLICYINSTLHYRLKGWIGDSPKSLEQPYFRCRLC